MPTNAPAAGQALALLRLLARHAEPVPAVSIARDLGLPRSSVYHLLAVLREQGFVVHLPEERRYGLGVAAFELGSAYTRQAPLQRVGRPVLHRLVDASTHSAHLAVLHGRDMLYLIEDRATRRPPLVTDVGVRLPAQLTASGLAMLAALPAAQVRALFPSRDAFVHRHDPSDASRAGPQGSAGPGGSAAPGGSATPGGPAGPGGSATPARRAGPGGSGTTGPRSLLELRQRLVGVRRHGFAVEDGSVTPGFASVAAAALDHNGHPVAGVAVTYPGSEVGREEAAALSRLVIDAAADLTRRMRGRAG